jgi:hypothetical protein
VPELALDGAPVMPLLETAPPALALVPPTELLALEPLGDVLGPGVLASELVPPVVLAVLLGVLPVVLAMLFAPLPLALVPVMLYFCSRSATRELSVEICCRICSISMSLDVAAAGLAVVTVDDDGVDSVVLLLVAGAGAPGAGVVVTTRSSRSLQPVNAVQTASAPAANMNLVRAMALSIRKRE